MPHITLVCNKREIRVAYVLFFRCFWDEIGCQYYEVQFCVCICQPYVICGGLYWSLFFGLHVYLLVQVTRILFVVYRFVSSDSFASLEIHVWILKWDSNSVSFNFQKKCYETTRKFYSCFWVYCKQVKAVPNCEINRLAFPKIKVNTRQAIYV